MAALLQEVAHNLVVWMYWQGDLVRIGLLDRLVGVKQSIAQEKKCSGLTEASLFVGQDLAEHL